VRPGKEGGGIRRSGLARIWTYLYTTADSPLKEMDGHSAGPVVLAGYGYGLPLSRLYARQGQLNNSSYAIGFRFNSRN